MSILSSLSWGTWDIEAVENQSSNNDATYIGKTARRKHTAKLFRASKDQPDAIYSISLNILQDSEMQPNYGVNLSQHSSSSAIPWETIAFSLSPPGGKLPPERWERKTIQVESMMIHVIKLLDHILSVRQISRVNESSLQSSSKAVVISNNEKSSSPVKVVEFCAGSGFVALPLAYMYPDVEFVLVDRKLKSMEIARERIAETGITNVSLIEGNVEDYLESFDIGIALHACGIASDYSIERCLRSRAAFVVCPCCIGKIVHHRNRPLSKTICEKLTELQYKHLVKAADFGHTDSIQLDKAENRQRRVCKSYVEEDRRRHAVEHGYEAYLYTMPIQSSPKNDIIVGWPVRDGPIGCSSSTPCADRSDVCTITTSGGGDGRELYGSELMSGLTADDNAPLNSGNPTVGTVDGGSGSSGHCESGLYRGYKHCDDDAVVIAA